MAGHVQVLAQPGWENCFIEGKRKSGGLHQTVSLRLSLAESWPEIKRSFSSSSWAVPLSQRGRAPLSGGPTLFKWGFCSLVFHISPLLNFESVTDQESAFPVSAAFCPSV